MGLNKILILTDNEELLRRFRNLLKGNESIESNNVTFDFMYSYTNKAFVKKFNGLEWLAPLKVKEKVEWLIEKYNLIISLHCKQLFPAELVNQVRCINVHPGLNPFNRGWYPQVFSILNSLPCGATIHEMDEHLDHGPIICQKEVKIEPWDTSLSAYNKIIDAEMELLTKYLPNIINNDYSPFIKDGGDLNLKNDFDKLCHLDLNEIDTWQNHINRLRALTHGDYSNAYFIDGAGNKIYIKVEMIRDGNETN